MSKRETAEVPVSAILSLASCAEDYGHTTEVLMLGLAEMLGYELSDDEIQEYADSFLEPAAREQGYGEEDAEEVADRLREWRDRYFDCPVAREYKRSREGAAK